MTMSSKMDPLNDHDLEKFLVPLAEEAGKVILQIYNSGDFQETEKEDRSPLTQADLA